MALVCEQASLPPPFASPPPAVVLVEAADQVSPLEQLASAVGSLEGVTGVAVAEDPVRRAQLWRYRERLPEAINTLGPPHKIDVTLPAARLEEFLGAVGAAVGGVASGADTWLFGHLGDGNVHVNVTGVDPGDDRVDEAVLLLVAELGGSISAEHGIGTAKRRWLGLGRSPAEIAAFRALKRALDPAGILNPNVLLPVAAGPPPAGAG
jgi:FAD/FMN-containing dehydrogenase